MSDVAFGKKCDGGAIIELLAANQLNFSQHQISTYVRQAPNKGNEVARLRIAAKSAFSLSLFLCSFYSLQGVDQEILSLGPIFLNPHPSLGRGFSTHPHTMTTMLVRLPNRQSLSLSISLYLSVGLLGW